MQTWLITIDSMIPIGRGQQYLIIGNREISKTTIAIKTFHYVYYVQISK